MSIKVMSWVMDDAPVENTTEMVVLYVLADHARDDGTCAWPSHATIADKTRCSRRTVIRHIKALEQRGLICRGDQRHVAHLPAGKRPVVWNLDMTMKRQMPDDVGCQNDTPQSSGVPSSAEWGDNGGKGGVPSSAKWGDTGVTQPVLDPSVDPSLTHPPLAPQGADGARAAESEQQPLLPGIPEGQAPTGHQPPAPQPQQHSPAKKRGTRVTQDFMPAPATVASIRAALSGVTDEWLRWEHDKFLDYWMGRAGAAAAKLDWEATWRNWMRTAWERNPGSRSQAPAAQARGTAPRRNSLSDWLSPEDMAELNGETYPPTTRTDHSDAPYVDGDFA